MAKRLAQCQGRNNVGRIAFIAIVVVLCWLQSNNLPMTTNPVMTLSVDNLTSAIEPQEKDGRNLRYTRYHRTLCIEKNVSRGRYTSEETLILQIRIGGPNFADNVVSETDGSKIQQAIQTEYNNAASQYCSQVKGARQMIQADLVPGSGFPFDGQSRLGISPNDRRLGSIQIRVTTICHGGCRADETRILSATGGSRVQSRHLHAQNLNIERVDEIRTETQVETFRQRARDEIPCYCPPPPKDLFLTALQREVQMLMDSGPEAANSFNIVNVLERRRNDEPLPTMTETLQSTGQSSFLSLLHHPLQNNFLRPPSSGSSTSNPGSTATTLQPRTRIPSLAPTNSQHPTASHLPSTLTSSLPSEQPSSNPSMLSTASKPPSTSHHPTTSINPSGFPTTRPSTSLVPSQQPSQIPSSIPSDLPSLLPSWHPSKSSQPGLSQTTTRSNVSSNMPSKEPTKSASPSIDHPSHSPTIATSETPSMTNNQSPSGISLISAANEICDLIKGQVECCDNVDCGTTGNDDNIVCYQYTCIHESAFRITLSWTGDDDLDLYAETPGGAIVTILPIPFQVAEWMLML